MSRKWLERTEKLFGEQTIDNLSQKTVAVLGLGGVGGAATEAVCRMGVGKLVLIDNDTVDITNLNRQLFATADMVGQSKCLAAKKRLLSINPDLNIICYERFFLPESLTISTKVLVPPIFTKDRYFSQAALWSCIDRLQNCREII